MHQNALPPQFIHTRNCTDYIVERNIVFDAQSYHAPIVCLYIVILHTVHWYKCGHAAFVIVLKLETVRMIG